MKTKILLTAGDSFTNCDDYDIKGNEDNRVWPIWLRERMPDARHFSEGLGGQGNRLIAHRTQYRLEQLLKQQQPQDILVGVMWSGVDRWEFYNSENLVFDNKNDINGEVNPVRFIADAPGGWAMTHPQYAHERNDLFYKYFYDPVWMQIQTLEAIIHTQRHLRERGIRYFMSQSFDGCLAESRRPDPNLSWLWDQIDFDTWLPVKSMQDWCHEHCPIDGVRNFHPRPEQCDQFVEQVVWPYLQQKDLL
jgi:hypothetical protein